MTRKETMYQGYLCSICQHELELKIENTEIISIPHNTECPVCSGYMTIIEHKNRIQVEFDDPHDLFGGYIFDDREPFGKKR